MTGCNLDVTLFRGITQRYFLTMTDISSTVNFAFKKHLSGDPLIRQGKMVDAVDNDEDDGNDYAEDEMRCNLMFLFAQSRPEMPSALCFLARRLTAPRPMT